MNFSYTANASLIKWAIFPDESADYISNTTATVMLFMMLKYVTLEPFHQLILCFTLWLFAFVQSIINRLRDHLQLPEKFGSYQLVELNVKPPVKLYVLFLLSTYYFLLTCIHKFFSHTAGSRFICSQKQEFLCHH